MPTNRRAPVRPLVASIVATLPLAFAAPAGAIPHQADPGPADLEVIYGITSVGHIHPGEDYDFHLGVANHGPAPAHDVRLVVAVPAMLTVGRPPAPCTFADHTLSCTFADLAAGETVDLPGRASLDECYVGEGSDIVRTATVSSETADGDETNNSITAAGPRVEGARDRLASCPALLETSSTTAPAPTVPAATTV